MQAFRFHPAIHAWFERRFGSPTEPQALGWPAIQSGNHTLIAAPTGSGKTLAAFLASLDAEFRLGLEGQLRDETHVVYVSPLKALSNDIHKNLEEPLAEIRAAIKDACGADIAVRAAVRTGDTLSADRQALARKPPHILVTTPESLYLLLTSLSGRRMLKTARTLIVDEIHSVVSNRRGAHLALSMERLAALAEGPVQRIGLSATQKPIEDVARFLVGTRHLDAHGAPRCAILDTGHSRAMDLAIELPDSPLEAVMSNEVWAEVYQRLAALIREHRTTLVFVNTRRMAERVAHNLCECIGSDLVLSHHGSLSTKLRLEAENRLKRGELKALVATASLELGIDIGSVDLVCQLGTTRSIATLLQRVGRAGHHRGGLPKGRLFPLTRDELVECVALLRSIARGDLDRLHIPAKPLDVLAQQIVACATTDDWREDALFDLVRSAYAYRDLSRPEFDEVVRMLAEGFSTKRGRRSALIHHDGVNHRIRARRGARLLALTSGGAIPDTGDYRVMLAPNDTFIGTVHEDFAVESMAGDIFQLGNASWRILQIGAGTVRVEDAHGAPPGIPFWLGEAPARTNEVSRAVAELRAEAELVIVRARAQPPQTADEARREALIAWLQQQEWGRAVSANPANRAQPPLPASGARQLAEYFLEGHRSLGALPSQDKLIIERFFDESGGMQLVIHSPFGSRLNRAWGLALRKRFCRTFNFELQSAATDDAIVLSLGTQHSFPLDEVFRYLRSDSVRDLLVQALLDAPMFAIRWRWNASRSLALPRQRGGRKIPAPLQRMESENLLAAIFPDQLACLENIAGDRQVPDHPLVRQTIDDCLTEAMDIEGLENLLRRIENGSIECAARDLPEPSPLAHEILNARPYAFLDNAPLEERRTRAVYTRRASQPSNADELGILDVQAINGVCEEAWPRATNPDELHDALLLLGLMTSAEAQRCARAAQNKESRQPAPDAVEWLSILAAEDRVTQLVLPRNASDGHAAARLSANGDSARGAASDSVLWVAAERVPMALAAYPQAVLQPPLRSCDAAKRDWDRSDAIRELVRGRMEALGPVTLAALAVQMRLPHRDIEQALLALEAEGFVLRGRFRPGLADMEWCDRRLLARIHRLTLHRLRAEIQPVSIADYLRFLMGWQHVSNEHKVEGIGGLEAVLELLDGCEAPAGAWEPSVLAARVKDYDPQWLDQLCFTGRAGWGRFSVPRNPAAGRFTPLRSSPITLFLREHREAWLTLAGPPASNGFSPDTTAVFEALAQGGALFFGEIVERTRLLQSRVEQALGELATQGWVTSDSFEGIRALLTPPDKRTPFGDLNRRRHHRAVTSIALAGRWSLLRAPAPVQSAALPNSHAESPSDGAPEAALDHYARVLLRRFGVVFRRLLDREAFRVSWYDLSRIYRRLEARGEIRGGHFVQGVGGEQFALPEAVGMLRSIRKAKPSGELIILSAADPLNYSGILTPGPRIAAVSSNRILFRDGVPLAALEAGRIVNLNPEADQEDQRIEYSLKIGRLPPALRPYYA
ncbi:MAG TPA: DEAD/DEAH box helicase [Verrucomicrobia bacterium]|nr:DEAD/DEAH box helicase [Verrucomicrobiota bacterium]HOP97825.1 DEAD/DEAH box helicase [Verrucomicrobiota bacterium]HPU55522.1 DEAD/DEAH box helicase [Verrucomicrobiota bacterium]